MRRSAVLPALLLTGVAVLAPGTGAGAEAPDPDAPPQVASFRFSPSPLKPGVRGAFRFVTSRSGSVSVALHRQVAGRRGPAGCVTPAKAPGGTACLIAVPAGTLRSSVDAGEGLKRFDGTVAGRRLPAGRYRATLRVTSAATGASAPAYATLRIAAG